MHPTDDELVLRYYEEPSADPEAIDAHLSGCGECRQRYQRLQRVMGAIDLGPPVTPAATDYESQLWAALQQRLPARRRATRVFWWNRLTWAAAACVGIAAATAWLIPRADPTTSGAPARSPASSIDEPDSAERVRLGALGGHLQRAERLVVELLHSSDDDETALTRTEADLEDLLAANRLYRQAAGLEGDTVSLRVLDDLERVLIELTRSSEGTARPAHAAPHTRRGAETVLFKLRVTSAEVRHATYD